jgi:cation transport ATPase
MMKIIDELSRTIYWLTIATFAFAGIILLTAAFPIFVLWGLLRNYKKDYNLLVALALIVVILWAIIGVRWLCTIY